MCNVLLSEDLKDASGTWFSIDIAGAELQPLPPTFGERVVALAKVLFENNPERVAPWEHRYTWSDALMDAVDIVVVSEALSEENE